MKRLFFISIVFFIVSCQNEPLSEASIKINRVLCEHKINPLSIDTHQPGFSWFMSSEEPGQQQSAYQILVASSPDLLTNGHGDIWNSGKVLSDKSSQIVYQGPDLESCTKYYWNVKIWDRESRISDYSKPAWFETAILRDEDWKADWISAPRVFDYASIDRSRKIIPKNAPPEPEEPAPIFRKEFNTDSKLAKARAYISGLGFYELYINGKKVDNQVLTPSFTDYSKTVQYSTFDISGFLKEGKNAIGIMLGNGWYNMRSRDVWSFDKASWIADPALLLQIEMESETGIHYQLISDESWKCAPGPIVFNQVRQGETYDATREQPGWDQPGFNDQNWFPVRKVRGPEGMLVAQSIQPSRIMKEISPVSIKKIRNGNYLVDFGQNMAGFVRLNVTGPQNTTIVLQYGERLSKDGTVDWQGNSNLVVDLPFQKDTYILKGGGKEEWHARFVYHGFQYVEISGFPGEPGVDNLTACVVHTSFPKTGTFECSNELLNRIQHNTEWSFINNYTAGFPTDCPQREKNGWTGDAQLASEAGLYNFDMSLAYEKWLRDIRDAQRKDGMLPAIIPTGGWGFYWGNGPAWDHALFAVPWYVYLYTGNIRILEENYKTMTGYMMLLDSVQDKFLVNWGLGDWLPAKTRTPAIITSTAYYYQDARILSRIAEILNKSEDHSMYLQLAENIKKAFNDEFFDEGNMTYGNGSQTALGCALYFGLVNPEYTGMVANSLVTNIKESELNLDFGILGSKYVPNALAENDQKDVIFEMINTTRYPGWGNWIERGANTLWESWQGDNSLNHVMFGDVSAWFYKYLAGIQGDENFPGFKHFYIDPYFAEDLDWVKASYLSPQGEILVRWEKSENDIMMNITIPVNSSATLKLEVSSSDDLLMCEDGPSDISFESLGIKEGKGFFKLLSGNYCLKYIRK